MKKFKELRLTYQAIRVYILSLLASLLTSPLFGKLYIKLFNPPNFGDFYTINDPHALLDGAFFAFYLFLALFTFWLVTKKQWVVWGVGIILPMLIAFTAGAKDFFYAFLLSFLGWFLAQAILFFKKKKVN